MRRLLAPRRFFGSGVVLLVVTALVLWLAPSSDYLLLPDRAHLTAPLVTVQDGKQADAKGGIYFVDVIERKATLLEQLFPGIRSDGTLVPGDLLGSPGESDAQRQAASLREMTRSQQVAAAVALRAAGYKVKTVPDGALVTAVAADVPAATKLRPTDVIVGVDGSAVRTAADLRRLIRLHRPGETIVLRVRRGQSTLSFSVRTVPDPQQATRPIVGIEVEQDAHIELPLQVTIDTGNVGGPSAGLAFALEVLQKLGRDVDRGYKVAATGEISLDGAVSPIGGVRQKAIGARETGIDVFLVPAGDNYREAVRDAGRTKVIAVTSFQQALHALATLSPKAS